MYVYGMLALPLLSVGYVDTEEVQRMFRCDGRDEHCPSDDYICTVNGSCLPCSSICLRNGKPNPGANCEVECPEFLKNYFNEDTTLMGMTSDHIAGQDTTEFRDKHINSLDSPGIDVQSYDENTVNIILAIVCSIVLTSLFFGMVIYFKHYMLHNDKDKLPVHSVQIEDMGKDGQYRIEDAETEQWLLKCKNWACTRRACTNTEHLYGGIVDTGDTVCQTSLCKISTHNRECQTDLNYSIANRAISLYSLNTLRTEDISINMGANSQISTPNKQLNDRLMPSTNKRLNEETNVPRESKPQSHDSVYPFEQAPDNTGDQYDSQASRYPFTDAHSAPSQYRPTVPSLQKPGVPIPNKHGCSIAVQTDVTISVEHGTSSTNVEAVQDTGSVQSQCPATAPSLTKVEVCDSAQLALIGSSAAPNDKL